MKRAAHEAGDELTDSLDFLIRDTRLRLYKYLEARVARLGIPLRIWFPLRVLARHEGITQRELGKMLGYGDAHAGAIVGAMQRHRLVERRASRHDKRRLDLYLTPAGRKTARLLTQLMRATNTRIVAGFSPAEARSLHRLLLRAHRNLGGAP